MNLQCVRPKRPKKIAYQISIDQNGGGGNSKSVAAVTIDLYRHKLVATSHAAGEHHLLYEQGVSTAALSPGPLTPDPATVPNQIHENPKLFSNHSLSIITPRLPSSKSCKGPTNVAQSGVAITLSQHHLAFLLPAPPHRPLPPSPPNNHHLPRTRPQPLRPPLRRFALKPVYSKQTGDRRQI